MLPQPMRPTPLADEAIIRPVRGGQERLDECGRLADARFPFLVRVLVLDAQHTVVADRLQGLDEGRPECPVMADSQRAEVPCPVGIRRAQPLVQHASDRQALRLGLGVLQVDVEDGLAQHADDGERIHLLPEKVRWVQIGPDDRTDGIPHALQGRHVVDELQWVQLERDPLDAVVPCVYGHRLPERDRLVPLAPEQSRLVIGPGRPDPVEGRAPRPVSRATGHRHDLVDAEPTGQFDGLPDELDMSGPNDRVEWPRRAVEGGDRQPARGQLVLEPREARRIAEQSIDLQVGGRRLAPGRDLEIPDRRARRKGRGPARTASLLRSQSAARVARSPPVEVVCLAGHRVCGASRSDGARPRSRSTTSTSRRTSSPMTPSAPTATLLTIAASSVVGQDQTAMPSSWSAATSSAVRNRWWFWMIGAASARA